MENEKPEQETCQKEENLTQEKREEDSLSKPKKHLPDPWRNSSFSKQEQRQIDLIRKYYPVDEKEHLVIVRLSYPRASDLFDENIGREEAPLLKTDLFHEIEEVVDDIPIGYRVEVHLRIDDYEDYTPKEIAENISDTMELNHFKGEHNRRKKWVTSAFLVIVGILILFLMGYGNSEGWFGTGESASLISEVLDIAAWVFIWEAVTILLVEPSENFVSRIGYIGRIDSFRFYQGESKEPLFSEDFRSEYRKRFDNSTHRKKFISTLFLVSGALEVIFGANTIFLSSIHFFQGGGDSSYTASTYAAAIIMALFQMLAGISATECYINQGRLRKLAPFFAVFSLILVTVLLINGIFFERTSSFWFNSWLSLALNIIYIAGYLVYRSNRSDKDGK